MKVKLKDQHRTGINRDGNCRGINVHVSHDRQRLTVPARETLESHGAIVEPDIVSNSGIQLYRVTLTETMPSGLVAKQIIGETEGGYTALRLEIEPEYPGECDHYWGQLDFTPCPKCNAPLMWYEAGYVPGYRVCARSPNHHWLARR